MQRLAGMTETEMWNPDYSAGESETALRSSYLVFQNSWGHLQQSRGKAVKTRTVKPCGRHG